MKKIPLTRGKFALIDDEDFERVSQHKWYFDGRYAKRFIRKDGRYKQIYLHAFIINTPAGFCTDHINRDKLDNQRDNLRIATFSQNLHNQTRTTMNKYGYRGIHFHKPTSSWCARLTVNNIPKSSHYFKIKEDAARAYDEIAKDFLGEFATLNFP